MKENISKFNIRVYGLWLKDNSILVSEECIQKVKVIKFPGGGLEFGEGTLHGLEREWNEELNAVIEIRRHFYTTDFFQKSAWDDSQVISIYYLVAVDQKIELPYFNGKERFYFLQKKDLLAKIDLPIDRIVLEKLIEEGHLT